MISSCLIIKVAIILFVIDVRAQKVVVVVVPLVYELLIIESGRLHVNNLCGLRACVGFAHSGRIRKLCALVVCCVLFTYSCHRRRGSDKLSVSTLPVIILTQLGPIPWLTRGFQVGNCRCYQTQA
jgi:hypothetical protein